VSGSYLYVSNLTVGMRIFDIADPASPRLAGAYDSPGTTDGVTVSGSYAYVADRDTGLQVVRVVSPANYSFVLDQNPGTVPDTVPEWNIPGSSYSGKADGVWYFHVRAQDYLGNWGPAAHRRVQIDVTAPVTTNDAPAGWQTADFTVTLACADPASGCASTSYRVDSGAWQAGTVVPINTEGDHTISYYSTDVAGNVEATKTVHAKLDKTAPVTTDDAPAGWVNAASVTVNLAWSDAGGSGCYMLWLNHEGEGWFGIVVTEGMRVYVTFDTEGDHTVQYYMVDIAGNTEAVKTARARIDRTAPVTTADAPSGWQKEDFKVDLDCADGLSGCASTRYRIDAGDWQTGTGMTISTDGDHVIDYYSTDSAGNVEATRTVHAMLDKTAPVTTDDAPDGWMSSPFTVTLSCSDGAGSGCADTRFSLDEGPEERGGEVPIETEGEHSITYYSIDNVGHVEETRKASARLDLTDPVVMNVAPAGPVSGADHTISADLFDGGGSGIDAASATISLDGGAPLTGCIRSETSISCPASGLGAGGHAITVSVSDNAGNAGSGGGTFTVILARDYYWTWYDNVYMKNWVLMGNPSGAPESLVFDLSVGGQTQDLAPFSFTGFATGEVPAGMTLTPRFRDLMGGPVKATSSTGGTAIVSQRSLMGDSLEEVLGVDSGKLSSNFFWTWYDQQSPGYRNWVLIANNGSIPVTYQVKVAGAVMPVSAANPGIIPAGGRVTPTFPDKMDGPVEVTASGPVMVSQRVTWNGYFNEVLGTVLE